MNPDEAKKILLLCRPDTPDCKDTAVAAALALVATDPELARWWSALAARHEGLRGEFRRITPPAGLREQILAETAAARRAAKPDRRLAFLGSGALAALLLVLAAARWFHPQPPADNTFEVFRREMTGYALRGYTMDLATASLGQARAYLQTARAPADFPLPSGLRPLPLTGCAVESWPGARVAMLCFRTGLPLPAGAQNDLWLFVVDQPAVSGAPSGAVPQPAVINRLATVTWSANGKLYFLGTTAGPTALRSLLGG